jgi:uncharacterized protein (DUF2236 family)
MSHSVSNAESATAEVPAAAAGHRVAHPTESAPIARVNGEAVVVLTGGRALVMQVAHPKVGAGVADHSDFQQRPWRRLYRTLSLMYLVSFADRTRADETAASIRRIHRHVTGPGYAASDPALLTWVNATLIDSALAAYQRFFRPLGDEEAEAFYQDATTIAEVLGAPRDRQPADLAAFRAYVEETLASIELTETAQEQVSTVLHPPVTRAASPLMAVSRQLTVGMLPPVLRQRLGLSWGPRREQALESAAACSRAVLPRLPRPLRTAHVPLMTLGRARA